LLGSSANDAAADDDDDDDFVGTLLYLVISHLE
uniref:WAPL domain-containing protein n=1 Tax=Anisakis simplex TaxID=6269 RepID=A0A0M3JBR0_ANISI